MSTSSKPSSRQYREHDSRSLSVPFRRVSARCAVALFFSALAGLAFAVDGSATPVPEIVLRNPPARAIYALVFIAPMPVPSEKLPQAAPSVMGKLPLLDPLLEIFVRPSMRPLGVLIFKTAALPLPLTPDAVAALAQKPAPIPVKTAAPIVPAKPLTAPVAVPVPAPAKPAPVPVPAKPAAAPAKPAAPPAVPPATPTAVPPAAPPVAKNPVPPSPPSSARIVDPAAQEVKPWKELSVEPGSRFNIPMLGSGWSYLGEMNGREGLSFDSRMFEGTNAVFEFLAERAGDYFLRFRRQDPVQGFNDDRYIRVIVAKRVAVSPAAIPGAPSGIPLTVPIPATTPAIVPSSQPFTAPAAEVAPAGVPATIPAAAIAAAPASDSPEDLVRFAKDSLAAKKAHDAISTLDKFMTLYPSGSDEVFLLFGKAYESDGPYRDIKKAHAFYKRIRDEFPRSKFWKEASDRVTYIERRYFEIR